MQTPVRRLFVVVCTFLVISGTAGASTLGLQTDSATAVESEPKVDVVFVVDRTESMDVEQYELRRDVGAIREHFDGVDAQYGLVTYAETARVDQELTDNLSAVESAMDFETAGTVEHASDGILAAMDMDLRSDAQTVVVLLTDEDDDASEQRREAALSALSGAELVSMSPADQSASSCDYHSPPCDSSDDNELRTYAEDLGGHWLDVEADTESRVESTSRLVQEAATATDQPTGDDGGGAEFVETGVSANRTTVEVGEPVEFEITVENRAAGADEYDARLSTAAGMFESKEVTIDAGETRTITLTHAFSEPGSHEMFISHEHVAGVEVTPRGPTEVNTTIENGSMVSAEIDDARADSPVRVPLDSIDSTDSDTQFGSLAVTPTTTTDFGVTVTERSRIPDEVPRLPDYVEPVSYLVVNSTLTEGAIANVTFERTASRTGSQLYRYDWNASTWTPLDRQVTNATNGTDESREITTTASGFSVFALGVRHPALSVSQLELNSTSITLGEATSATVTVANDGVANGTYTANLTTGDSVVASETVTVPANTTRRVTLTYVPDAPGEYQVSINGDQARSLVVEQSQTAEATATVASTATATEIATEPTTATARPTATPTPAAEPAQAETAAASGPGFGLLLALAGLSCGLCLLASRR